MLVTAHAQKLEPSNLHVFTVFLKSNLYIINLRDSATEGNYLFMLLYVVFIIQLVF